MSIRKWSHGVTAKNVIETCRLLQGGNGMDDFLDVSSYNYHAALYSDFETVLNALFENFARRILCGMPIPPMVETFFQELLAPVRKFQSDMVGFSVLFSQQLYFALALAERLKEAGVKVVLGGATLTVMPHPEDLLSKPVSVQIEGKYHKAALSSIVDYLIIGEGEKGIAALVDDSGGSLSRTPGLVYTEGGRTRSNPPEMIDDLNLLPAPDFSDMDPARYHSPLPVLPYLSSRGCFWQRCAFCTHRKTYLAYREESVENTADRLSTLKDLYGVSHFTLVDEMIHARRFKKLGHVLMQRNINIHYAAYTKPVPSFNRPLLEKLYLSGARVLMWGVESGNQRVLDAMKKGNHAHDMEQVLRDAHEAGIWNLAFIMFGFPSETWGEWKDTLDFLERNATYIDALSKSRFLLLMGSEVFRHPHKFHISRIAPRNGRDPISVAFNYEVSQGLKPEEVQKLYNNQLPVLQRYGKSPYFATFRDHLLIHASHSRSCSTGQTTGRTRD
jgi:radical SAM superfamily enzyme YgiQ (UPF0313 family)